MIKSAMILCGLNHTKDYIKKALSRLNAKTDTTEIIKE